MVFCVPSAEWIVASFATRSEPPSQVSLADEPRKRALRGVRNDSLMTLSGRMKLKLNPRGATLVREAITQHAFRMSKPCVTEDRMGAIQMVVHASSAT